MSGALAADALCAAAAPPVSHYGTAMLAYRIRRDRRVIQGGYNSVVEAGFPNSRGEIGVNMTEQVPTIRNVEIAEIDRCLPQLVQEVSRGKTRILVERDGIGVAALISIADLERLAQADRARDERFAAVERMREAFQDIPSDDIERDITALIREMRRDEEATRHVAEHASVDRRSA